MSYLRNLRNCGIVYNKWYGKFYYNGRSQQLSNSERQWQDNVTVFLHTLYKYLVILSYKDVIKSKSLRKWTNCNIYLQCPCLFTRNMVESLFKFGSE